MTKSTLLDTTITEPPADAGEAEMLLFALDRSRAQFAWKAGGLDAAGLDRPHPPSALTLRNLLRHLAQVEYHKVTVFVTGDAMRYPDWPPLPEPSPPWLAVVYEDPDWAWRVPEDETPEQTYRIWDTAVRYARDAWRRAVAEGGLDQPSRYAFEDGFRPSLRRILVDLQDEYARHTGHADLLREAVDGLVGEDPPQ
jgi:hypothetical protein